MVFVRPYDPSARRVSKWSGGETTELFIWPEDASYSERRFQFRISTATVETECSTFTVLPGVHRFLTPLSPEGFTLVRNGAESRRLLPGEVLSFSGEDHITCFGSGRDLNLMLQGPRGEMRIVEAGGEFELPEAEFIFFYAAEDAVLAWKGSDSLPEDQTAFSFAAGDFVRVTGGGTFETSGRTVLFIVY